MVRKEKRMRHDIFAGKKFAPLVLPAVYDDVLSYEEWLSKIIFRINELQQYIDDTMENIEQIIDQTVTNKLVPVKNDISNIKVRLNTIDKTLKDLDQSIKSSLKKAYEYSDRLNNKTNQKFDKEVTEIHKLIGKYYDELKHADERLNTALTNAFKDGDLETLKEAKRYTHHIIGVNNNKIFTSIQELSDRIDNILNEYPELYDPATGEYEHMQRLVYRMYRALRTFGIQSMLYDDQQITAEEYDAMGLDAQVYDTAMVWRLWHKFKCMFNPVTGKQESLADIVNFLFTQLRFNGKTVEEFESYDATVGQLDDSTYNAWEQDNSKYYTAPEIDVKNKAYRNWILIAQDPEGIAQVEFAKRNMTELSVKYSENGFFTIPLEVGTYTAPNGETIIISENDSVNATFTGLPLAIYGVTYVKDISELDK